MFYLYPNKHLISHNISITQKNIFIEPHFIHVLVFDILATFQFQTHLHDNKYCYPLLDYNMVT